MKTIKNPFPEIVNEEVFEFLRSNRLINERGLRDYVIRQNFRAMRKDNISTGTAILTIKKDYPNLEYDTLRKIVYDVGR